MNLEEKINEKGYNFIATGSVNMIEEKDAIEIAKLYAEQKCKEQRASDHYYANGVLSRTHHIGVDIVGNVKLATEE